MTAGFDGSVNINTKIDDKSFNAGISKLAKSAKAALGEIAFNVAMLGVSILSVVAGIVAAGIAVVFFGIKLIDAMSRAISSTNAYGKQIAEIETLFADVQGAVYAAFSPLVAVALPYIKIVVNWLVNMFNTISMIVAALLGQKTVMQYVAGSADTAATATGKMAGNTSKAAKAAKGALAAFDQINVLAQSAADASGAGGGGGAMQMKQVDVSPEAQAMADKILGTWEKLKTAAIQTWEIIKWAAGIAWDWIAKAATDAWEWIKQAAIDTWEWVKQAATDAWTWVSGVWAVVASWFQLNVIDPLVTIFLAWWGWMNTNVFQPIGAAFTWLFNIIADWVAVAVPLFVGFANAVWIIIQRVVQNFSDGFTMIWNFISLVVQNIVSNFINGFTMIWNFIQPLIGWIATGFTILFNTVGSIIGSVVVMVTGVITSVITIIGGIIEFITGVFSGNWKLAWKGVVDVFSGIWGVVVSIVVGVVNTVIDLVNGMISALVTGVNIVIGMLDKIKLPSWLGGGGVYIAPIGTYKIPHIGDPGYVPPNLNRYAAGGVFQPNAPFAAILGDQRSGVNVEAPADLIRQLVAEGIDKAGGGGSQNITIQFANDNLSALMRLLQPYAVKEGKRIGISLISGGGA